MFYCCLMSLRWQCAEEDEEDERQQQRGAGEGAASRRSRPRERIKRSRQCRGSPRSVDLHCPVDHRAAAYSELLTNCIAPKPPCEGESLGAGATVRPSRPRERIQASRQRTGSPASPPTQCIVDRAAARTPEPSILKAKKSYCQWETVRSALKAGNKAAKRLVPILWFMKNYF